MDSFRLLFMMKILAYSFSHKLFIFWQINIVCKDQLRLVKQAETGLFKFLNIFNAKIHIGNISEYIDYFCDYI